MNQRRPLIGITMRHELETDRFYLARHYSEAIEHFGGVPVYLSLIPRAEYISAAVERLDGILLPGSASDVDPLRYNREPHLRLGAVHPLRDETDALVLKELERRRLPLLAICFGMQMWNVSRGGTLIQDISTEYPKALKHEQGAPRDRTSHRVNLLTNSMLSGLSAREQILVNSHHHQALETLGADLRAVGWATDGLIEAVEDVREGRWGLGVQWHPEIAWSVDELSQRIFSNFIQAAQAFTSVAGDKAAQPGAASACV